MNETLKSQLQADLNRARKDRNRDRITLLSMTLSELHNREIELGAEVDNDEVQALITRAIKRRREAAEQMRGGGRPELALREEEEAKVLATYLPPPFSEAEVREMIREIVDGGTTAVGPVMGQLSARIRGRFDGKEANRLVREALQS